MNVSGVIFFSLLPFKTKMRDRRLLAVWNPRPIEQQELLAPITMEQDFSGEKTSHCNRFSLAVALKKIPGNMSEVNELCWNLPLNFQIENRQLDKRDSCSSHVSPFEWSFWCLRTNIHPAWFCAKRRLFFMYEIGRTNITWRVQLCRFFAPNLPSSLSASSC